MKEITAEEAQKLSNEAKSRLERQALKAREAASAAALEKFKSEVWVRIHHSTSRGEYGMCIKRPTHLTWTHSLEVDDFLKSLTAAGFVHRSVYGEIEISWRR